MSGDAKVWEIPLGDKLIELSSEIIAAYVSNNSVPASDLPSVLIDVHRALQTAMSPEQATKETVPPIPALPIKKSITPDYIICLEDGKQYRTLRRTLKARFNMTPEQYRERWGLPKDYPMVAPNFSTRRSEVAKQIGLGKMSGFKVTPVRKKKVS